jgi:hypothetical protein
VLPPVQKAFGPVPVNIVATTSRSVEEFSKPAMTPFTISVV